MTECYVVTGGAGFVGSNLCWSLASRAARRGEGVDLIVIDDFRSGSFANLVEAFESDRALGIDPSINPPTGPFTGELIAASVGEIDWPTLLEARSPDAVFHLGAITDTTIANEREMLETNAETFGPMLGACVDASVPLVYASSAATYGSPPQAGARVPFPPDAAGAPNNIYGFSKWLMECEHRRVLDDARHAGKAPPHVVGLRYFNVFGPGESRKHHMASMVHQLATQILDGQRPRIFTDGEQARDQVPVADVAACTIAAAGIDNDHPITPGVHNLGSGRATTYNEIVEAIRSALGLSESDRPTEYFEMPAHVRTFYQDYTCADMGETERGLGWTPAIDPLAAMGHYAQYLAQSRGLSPAT